MDAEGNSPSQSWMGPSRLSIGWTWQFKAVRAIIVTVKITVLIIAASYLDQMSAMQRWIYALGFLAAVGDSVTGDVRAIRRISLSGDRIIFHRLLSEESRELSDLMAVVHPWYDISRVWVKWTFTQERPLVVTLNFNDLYRFISEVESRSPANIVVKV